ncbi:transcription factor ORG2-like isoform X2 [Lotus japonicus]|uniref:transcription factor ORG2-like isoform X2 n=1 Tax=Lotus japonicus TaxID=34305 RepID=UPI0025867517|nr:transcription factor ORG2-like isoform X2 [Lotus japonicus]
MLAFSATSVFSNSNIEWLLAEEPFSYNHHHNYLYNESVSSLEYAFPPHQPLQPPQAEEVKRSMGPPSMAKKLNHNASERNRRNKINTLITLLRSLLPGKKMSIQATISQVTRYIPELEQQVEGLIRKQEELRSRISRQRDDAMDIGSKMTIPHDNSNFKVSTSWINDNEAAIHISSCEVYMTPLSEILLYLENNGHFLLNASSSETFEGRVFYNLHFQVEKAHRIESCILTEKLLSIYEKKQSISNQLGGGAWH